MDPIGLGEGLRESRRDSPKHGVGLDEDCQANRAGRLDVEAVAADDAAANRLEDLGGFGGRELLRVGFETLDREFPAKKLLDDGGQMSEHRGAPK